MPVELNGKFWGLDELAGKVSIKYNTLYMRLVRTEGLIRIGKIILVPDALAQEILAKEEKKKAYIPINVAANEIGVNFYTLKMLVKYYFKNNSKNIKCTDFEKIRPAIIKIKEAHNGRFPFTAIQDCIAEIEKIKNQEEPND